MATIPLDSTVLSGVAYDADHKVLELTFYTGKTYLYAEVEPAIYHGLLTAKSAGQYYGQHIRGQYKAPEEQA